MCLTPLPKADLGRPRTVSPTRVYLVPLSLTLPLTLCLGLTHRPKIDSALDSALCTRFSTLLCCPTANRKPPTARELRSRQSTDDRVRSTECTCSRINKPPTANLQRYARSFPPHSVLRTPYSSPSPVPFYPRIHCLSIDSALDSALCTRFSTLLCSPTANP